MLHSLPNAGPRPLPATRHRLEGGAAGDGQACEPELRELSCVGFVCFTLTREPLAFWWQVPCPQGYSSKEVNASGLD